MSAKRIKYLEDKINNRSIVKSRRASGNTIATQQLENDIFLAEAELNRIAKGKGYILHVPKGKGSISYEDTTGIGGKINSIQNVNKTGAERVAAAAKSVSGVKDSKKEASTDDFSTLKTAADRRKEFKRQQKLAAEKEAAKLKKETALQAELEKQKKRVGRVRIRKDMLASEDRRHNRDKSKERLKKTEEAKDWSEKLRLKRENNLSGITNAQLKEYTLDEVKEKVNRLRERQASYDKSRLEKKKKIEEEKRAEVRRERREMRERVAILQQKRQSGQEALQVKKEKDYKHKLKILEEACKRFFGDGSFLYKTFDITHNPGKMQDLINNIVKGLIEAEKMTSSRKEAFFNGLANKIFLYIREKAKIKGDLFDELLNDILMNNSLHKAYFDLHNYIMKHMTTRDRDYSIRYEMRLLPDTKARQNFERLMNELYTNNTRKSDIIRTYLLEQNKKGKKYLQKAKRNVKPAAGVVRRVGNRTLSQTKNQKHTGYYIDGTGGKIRKIEGDLRGEQVTASSFDPNSLKASHPKPTDSKFFMDARYGHRKNILHYFLYEGMIRYYEHGFYIPGDDTLHGEREGDNGKLEHLTNARSGTIKKEGNREIWYSQTPEHQWVWKQSMKGENKSHNGWKDIKKDFKYNSSFVGTKTTDISVTFKNFVEQQQNNPRYIIFKGISTLLFEDTRRATNKKDPFKYGFIDTESCIKLGDYIMFECINNYHETSKNAFREGQQPQFQTPLMFFIHKDHLHPPKDIDKLDDWANKRSILSEYEYRELFLNKLMEQQYTPLMKEIQSLTDFTTAGKYCEDPNSINKNHTELCYSTGETDAQNPIYKSNVIFPEEQFKAMSGEAGILAIQYSILENFITGTQKKIEDLEKTECISMGEPCFKLILEAYDEIATFKTTTQQRLDDEMSLLTEYTVFLHQLLDLNLTGENKKQVFDEIEKVKNFTQTVTQKFMKLINGKKLDQILKNMFNKNSERLIEFKTIQQEDFQWLNLEEEKKRRDAIDDMEKEWKEQKTKFNGLMDKYFKDKWAEAAADLKDKIAKRDNEIARIIDEYNNASKKAHDEDVARKEEEARLAAEEAARLKKEADEEEAARLKKIADEKAKEAARLKKIADEKAKKEKEAARKKALLATLRKWQETYEKEKREEERRVLMGEIRENYNKAIEHNIKIRKEINDKLEELGEIEKELLEKNDPDIYTKLIRLGSKWETQILSLKDKGLEDKISQCLKEFTDLLGNVKGLLTKYEDSHLSSYATNIKKIKDELEEKIGRCEGFIKEVKQHHIALLELNENFDDDGKVMDASLMDIHSAIVKIDTVLTPTQHPDISIDDVAAEDINEDPIPKLMKPIILELKSKLQDKEKEMKYVVSDKLKGINDELMQKKKEMENILKEYGYKNTPEEEEQNNDKITIIKAVIDLFDSLKKIMQEENNIEISIEDIFKEKSSDDEKKIPEGGWDRQDIEEGKNLRKTNEEELKELEKKRIEKEALEEQLNVQKKLLDVKTETLKKHLKTLRNLVDMDKFKNKLKEAVENTEEIFEKVDEMKKVYEAEQGKDLDQGEEKASIKQILTQFEKKIIEGGVSLMKKREDIELIHDILENKLKEAVTIEDIEKIMKGSNGEDGLPVKLMMVPKYLINITTFLLEDAIYNKALLENNKHMAAAEKKNAELEQTRLNKEEEINNRIKKEKEDRLAAEKKKREEEEEARLVALEKNRLEQVARDKEEYEKDLTERQNYFEEAERNYKKLLSRYDESRYSKETKDLNDELMEMIFKSGLLHSDQTYQEEDKPGHRQGVEDWFDTTQEGIKRMGDDVGYEEKLEKYNEAMKKTNEIFG